MSNHACQIDEAHFRQWVTEMRTTTSKQCMGKLKAEVGSGPEFGFCCLGLGTNLIEGVVIQRAGLDIYDDDGAPISTEQDTYYLMDGADDLAPDSFARWLSGSDTSESGEEWFGNSHDVYPDLVGVTMQGKRDPRQPDQPLRTNWGDLSSLSAAGMNDDGMTFAQIADVFAYFGVRRITN